MTPRTKITLAALIIAIAGTYYGFGGGELFKGMIVLDDTGQEDQAGPDLTPKLEIQYPDLAEGNITALATIENNGEGSIDGKTPFHYAIYIDEEEVFSNTDSYTTMESGDSFTFNYEIPKEISPYNNSGTLTFVVDSKNDITEADEKNNRIDLEYSF